MNCSLIGSTPLSLVYSHAFLKVLREPWQTGWILKAYRRHQVQRGAQKCSDKCESREGRHETGRDHRVQRHGPKRLCVKEPWPDQSPFKSQLHQLVCDLGKLTECPQPCSSSVKWKLTQRIMLKIKLSYVNKALHSWCLVNAQWYLLSRSVLRPSKFYPHTLRAPKTVFCYLNGY